ncbi:MAG: hypothetical protein HY438_03495 [DPANN group archaeon]|nr:hypothetical protein [DPANN group archaeon]
MAELDKTQAGLHLAGQSGFSRELLEKLNSLGLPEETKAKIVALINESNNACLHNFSDKVIAEIGFAGKIALIPSDKIDYLKSNIKAMVKIEGSNG